jgi:DNA-binding protein HU-beta
MNKKDLVDEVSKVTGGKKEAESAVECVLDTIKNALKKGDKVTLTGFGSFSVATRAARKGRNPRTGEEIKIKESKVPRFSPAKEFKNMIQ